MKKIKLYIQKNIGNLIATIVFSAFIVCIFWFLWIPPFQNNGYRRFVIYQDLKDGKWVLRYSKFTLFGTDEWGFWVLETKAEALKIKNEIKAGQTPSR